MASSIPTVSAFSIPRGPIFSPISGKSITARQIRDFNRREAGAGGGIVHQAPISGGGSWQRTGTAGSWRRSCRLDQPHHQRRGSVTGADQHRRRRLDVHQRPLLQARALSITNGMAGAFVHQMPAGTTTTIITTAPQTCPRRPGASKGYPPPSTTRRPPSQPRRANGRSCAPAGDGANRSDAKERATPRDAKDD